MGNSNRDYAKENAPKPENMPAADLLAEAMRTAKFGDQKLAVAIGYEAYQVVQNWRTGRGAIDPTKLSEINAALGLNESAAQALLYARLPALNPQWLDAQSNEIQAGLYLAALREYKGLTQSELDSCIDANAGETSQYEHGKRPPTIEVLRKIEKSLGLTEEQYQRLISLSYTQLHHHHRQLVDNHKGLSDADRTVRQYAGLFFGKNGALYPRERLNVPPGMLLRALRLRAEITSDDFAGKLDISVNCLRDWELGEYNIDGSKLPVIKKILDLDEAEYQHLRLARFPAFDDKWLELQPSRERARLLLEACREHMGITQEMMRQETGVEISSLERGQAIFNKDIREKIIDALRKANLELPPEDRWFSDELAQHFQKVCEDSVAASRGVHKH